MSVEPRGTSRTFGTFSTTRSDVQNFEACSPECGVHVHMLCYSTYLLGCLCTQLLSCYAQYPRDFYFDLSVENRLSFPSHVTMAQDHTALLNAAIDGIESKFYVSGSASRGIKLTMGETACAFPMSTQDAKDKLAPLVAAARPSPFGRGNETVLDPSVRVAKELLPTEFDMDFDISGSQILEEVSAFGKAIYETSSSQVHPNVQPFEQTYNQGET